MRGRRGKKGAIATLDQVLESAIGGLASDLKKAKGLERAKLAIQLANLSESMRKREAAARKQLAQITIESVLQWARGLDLEKREEIVRAIMALDSKRSGLA